MVGCPDAEVVIRVVIPAALLKLLNTVARDEDSSRSEFVRRLISQRVGVHRDRAQAAAPVVPSDTTGGRAATGRRATRRQRTC